MQRIERTGPTQPCEEVNRVALQALSFVVPSLQQGGYVRKPLESFVSQLYAALLRPDLRAIDAVVGGMRKAHIPAHVIADTYAPVLARRLGDDWLSDVLDFSAVTLATSRLQGMVRRLEAAWTPADGTPGNERSACLVGVPRGIHHTLGSTILAGQLRHRGVYVQLSLDLTPETLVAHMNKEPFSAVFLSLACDQHSGLIRDLVAASHRHSKSTPVIVGGPVVDYDKEIMNVTKADLATCDIDEAMTFAGISSMQRAANCANGIRQAVLP